MAPYDCLKNSLKALNVFYAIIGIILIAVAAYAKGAAKLSSVSIAGGIIACGVFLFLVALIGFIGAHKHHQVLLFIYMVVLGIVFIIELGVSIAALAVSDGQKQDILYNGWVRLSDDAKNDIQSWGACCGFQNASMPPQYPDGRGTICPNAPVGNGTYDSLLTCFGKLESSLNKSFHAVGVVGIVFAFTELIGIALALAFRNQKNPKANPSAFL
eukprot:Opistho-2@6919